MTVPTDLFARGIRQELRDFVRDAGRRRALPYTVYVGVPGSLDRDLRTPLPHDPGHDQVLRTDLVERVVDGLPEPVVGSAWGCAWATRSGEITLDTRDLHWLAAVRGGFARHGLELPAFFVVSRTGWHEALSGRTRRWNRVRPRKSPTGT